MLTRMEIGKFYERIYYSISYNVKDFEKGFDSTSSEKLKK